jgi:hypothetical protein
MQPPLNVVVAVDHSIQQGSLAMKYLPIVAVALVASLGACSIKEERTVQQPAPTAPIRASE